MQAGLSQVRSLRLCCLFSRPSDPGRDCTRTLPHSVPLLGSCPCIALLDSGLTESRLFEVLDLRLKALLPARSSDWATRGPSRLPCITEFGRRRLACLSRFGRFSPLGAALGFVLGIFAIFKLSASCRKIRFKISEGECLGGGVPTWSRLGAEPLQSEEARAMKNFVELLLLGGSCFFLTASAQGTFPSLQLWHSCVGSLAMPHC